MLETTQTEWLFLMSDKPRNAALSDMLNERARVAAGDAAGARRLGAASGEDGPVTLAAAEDSAALLARMAKLAEHAEQAVLRPIDKP